MPSNIVCETNRLTNKSFVKIDASSETLVPI